MTFAAVLRRRLIASGTQVSKRAERRARLGAATLPLVAALLGNSAGAATTKFYDGDGLAPVNGSSGFWNTGAVNWASDAAGTTYSTWDNSQGDTAVFTGGGTIQITSDVAAGGLDFRGGNYSINQLGGALSLDATPAPTINVDAASTIQFLQSVNGSSGFTKTGQGTLYFNRNLTTSGPLNINEGTVKFALSAADFKDAHAMTIAAGGTFDMGVVNDGFGSLAGSGTVKFGSILQGGALQGPQLTVGADNTSTTFSGTLSGVGGQFFKAGTGTMVLSGANTFQGRVGVQGGTLRVEGGQAIGDTSDVFFSPPTGTTVFLDLGASERVGAIGSSGSAAAVLGNGFTFTIGSDITPNIQFNGRIEGAGTKVIKVGSGLQQFATASNASTYTGGTEIRGGALLVSGDAKLGDVSSAVTLDGGTLENFNTVSLTHARAFSIGTNGGRIQVNNNPTLATYSNTAQLTMTINGLVSGSGVLSKAGPGRLTLSNVGNSFGGLTVNEGSVFTNANTGTPLGSGSVRMNGGELIFTPGNATAVVSLTMASAAGATFSYGDGNRLQLNRNGNTSLTVTAGDANTSTSSLVHLPGGTIEVIPNSGVANLGNPASANREAFVVTGGVPVRNGIVDPSIVAWSSGGSSVGEYLTYSGTNGLQLATYAGNDLNAALPTDVIKTAAPQVLLADKTVYALNTAHLIGGAANLRLGDGTNSAGLIMNIGAQVSTTSLTFDGDEAAIYAQNTAAGIIDAPVTITHGGLSKFGQGTVRLNAAATYTGPTVIGSGTLSLGASNVLPATTAVRFGGYNSIDSSNTNAANLRLNLALNGNQQTIAGLSSINHLATIDLGGGKLTDVQNSDSTYLGRIVGTGTFEKAGSGKLVLNPNDNNSISDGIFASAYSALVVSGGTLEFSSFGSMPTLPASFQSDLFTLKNGATLRWAGLTTLTTTQSVSTSVNALRGVTLGAGGGTIDVVNPYEILLWQFAQGSETGGVTFSGEGGLTKKGAGYLRLGAGNTYQGKTAVLEGNLQFANDTALGQAPANFVPDQLFIDNGAMIQTNASGWIAATRGVKIGAGGAVINSGTGSYVFNSVVSGPGTIIRTGNSTATDTNFNAANNTFGGIILRQGQTFFNGNESAGSGSITIDPFTQVTFGKNEGPDNTISNPIQLGAGAAIDIRVKTGVPTGTNSIFANLPVGNLTLAGKISGPGALFMGLGGTIPNGDGTVVLTNATNDFTGEFGIYLGTVQVNANNALGATTGSTTVTYQGTLAFNNVQYTTPERINLGGTGVNGSGALRGIGASKVAGPVHLTADTQVTVDPGSTLELAGQVTGAYAMAKTGDGKLVLSGTGNTWKGDTTLQAGTLDFASNHRIGQLIFSGGTTATVRPGNKLLRTTAVQFNDPVNPNATLDLTDGRLIVDYADGSTTPLSQVRNSIIAGYNTAGPSHWTGQGITSSTAASTSGRGVGYAEASEIVPTGTTTWLGEGNIDTTAILVRTTLLGDANLDGATDFLDLARLAQNYNTTVKDTTDSWWVRGDFNYDGMVDFLDLAAMAQNYNTALPSAPIPGASADFQADLARAFASVPEPGALGVMSAAALAALTRRRRRRRGA